MATLTGKNAVVTGSTSGIGLAYARAFAKEGANIVLNGMGTPADIEKERSRIETDLKVKAVEAGCDVVMPRSAFSQNLVSILRRHGADDDTDDTFNRV